VVKPKKSVKQKAKEAFRKRALEVLDHTGFQLIFAVATIWALFIDDITIAANWPKEVDLPFAWVSFIFLILFVIDQLVRTWLDWEVYAFSFDWWIDTLGSASMYTSIMPIFITCDLDGGLALGQGVSVGARLGRVMRLMRVIRVVKVLQRCLKKRKGEDEHAVVEEDAPQSAVGKRLNQLIIQEVIIMTLALQIIYPFLTASEIDQSRELTFPMLVGAYSTPSFPAQLNSYQYTGEKDGFAELLYVEVNETRVFTDYNGASYPDCFSQSAGTYNPSTGCPSNISTLRCAFIEKYTSDFGAPVAPSAWATYNQARASQGLDALDWAVTVWSVEYQRTQEALKNVCLTIFLICVLLFMFTSLAGDVTSLVVRPIESMVDVVKKLAENPTLQLDGQTKSKYETEAVRVALAKIVGLMQLGFGGAGHEIISSNLANSDAAGLDLLLPGVKKECAYGFCDIRQFTDTVECLQDQVMLFTNSVAEILHQSCHCNRGEPNSNIGDAFLIVWRPKMLQDHSKIVDGALTSFRRCVREIASSQTLMLVTNVPAIHKKFGQDKYRTKIGFGLHFGWSVEGPVGTNTKIDCIYLSPEVKVADRLETATKLYSCNILMSGQFYDLLSDHLKVGIRLVDHITLKGGHKPLRLYADDRSNLWLKMNPRLIEIYGAEAAYEQFSKTFHEGIDAFIKGDWPAALQKLEGAADFCPQDTPTRLLMKEMKKRSIDANVPTAPVDWKGYHDSDL